MKIKKFPKALRSAFTLVELLVVISIIAVLAGIAMPAMTGVIERGQQTKVVSDARQIYLALKMYAGDNDGLFLQAASNYADANEAFKKLLENGTYLTTEKPFFVSKSKWCTGGKPLDGITSDNNSDLMKGGVNHFGFAAGLSDSSTPGYPLIMDGPSADSNSTAFNYATSDGVQGGLWKGKSVVVVYVDGSAKAEKTYLDSGKAYALRPGSTDSDKKNLIQVENAGTNPWMAGATLLLPKEPEGSAGGGGGGGGS